MKKKVIPVLIVVMVAMLGLLVSCNKARTVKPEHKAITEAVYASGYIVPKNEYKVSNNEKFVLYPNPAKDVVTLAYSLDNNAKLSFEVYNMLGQMVSSDGQSNFDKGSYTTMINIANFANGIYFVTVKDDAKVVETLKFVIAK